MISIIVAVAQNGIIGGDNSLLWHIKEDLQHFKAVTLGHPVIMGRKTFLSLGRPLPGRENVIITRNRDFVAEGCTVVYSLQEAVSRFDTDEEVFIIGGAEIYKLSLDVADKFYLTNVFRDYEGDTSFPEWDAECWQEISREYFTRGEKFDASFEFVEYRKK